MLDDEEEDESQEIPLPNIHSKHLRLVLDFLNHYHSNEPMTPIAQPLISSNMNELVQEWYCNFISTTTIETQFQLISAANYLDIKPLLDLSCASIAAQIKDKTTEEIRAHFQIINDFTAVEEAQIREEMRWCDVAAVK